MTMIRYIGCRLHKDGSRVVEDYSKKRETELLRHGYDLTLMSTENEWKRFLDKDKPPSPKPLTAKDRWWNWALGKRTVRSTITNK